MKQSTRKQATQPSPAAPLDDPSADFYHRVYAVVRRIPIGCVTTYGTIAAYLGMKSSSRAVGYAMMAAPEDMDLPCHRVVNRNGELSGRHHFATPHLMRDLLESEGIAFDGDAVRIAEHRWDPAEEEVERKRASAKPRAKKK